MKKHNVLLTVGGILGHLKKSGNQLWPDLCFFFVPCCERLSADETRNESAIPSLKA
jgi:hypothetical protein